MALKTSLLQRHPILILDTNILILNTNIPILDTNILILVS